MLQVLRHPRLLWCLSVGAFLVAIGSTTNDIAASSNMATTWNWRLFQVGGITAAAAWCVLPAAILASAWALAKETGRRGNRQKRRDVRHLLLFGVGSALMTVSVLVSTFQGLGARPFQENFLGSAGVQNVVVVSFWVGSVILAIAVIGLALRAGFGRLTSPDSRVFSTTALLLTGMSVAASAVPFWSWYFGGYGRFGEVVSIGAPFVGNNDQFDYLSALTLLLIGATLFIAANKRMAPRGFLVWSGLGLFLIAFGIATFLSEPASVSVKIAGAIVTGAGFAVLGLVAASMAVAVGGRRAVSVGDAISPRSPQMAVMAADASKTLSSKRGSPVVVGGIVLGTLGLCAAYIGTVATPSYKSGVVYPVILGLGQTATEPSSLDQIRSATVFGFIYPATATNAAVGTYALANVQECAGPQGLQREPVRPFTGSGWEVNYTPGTSGGGSVGGPSPVALLQPSFDEFKGLKPDQCERGWLTFEVDGTRPVWVTFDSPYAEWRVGS